MRSGAILGLESDIMEPNAAYIASTAFIPEFKYPKQKSDQATHTKAPAQYTKRLDREIVPRICNRRLIQSMATKHFNRDCLSRVT